MQVVPIEDFIGHTLKQQKWKQQKSDNALEEELST